MRRLLLGLSLFPLLLDGLHWSESQNSLREIYGWRQIDLYFPFPELRKASILSGHFIPANNLPLGVEVWGDRIFLSLPKLKEGVPVTLATVPRNPSDDNGEHSPLLQPYPNWNWHFSYDCNYLVSVFRTVVDPCGRLWVLDSGTVDIVTNLKQQCPPKLLIFDLRTDTLLRSYQLPDDQAKQDSLFTSIIVDVRDDYCDDTFAYIADVWRFGLVVYNLKENISWRITHSYFLPDPLLNDYELFGLKWIWRDGIFGMSLSPIDRYGDRVLFFHPMSSYREFGVSTSVIRSPNASEANPEAFIVFREPRGYKNSHSSTAALDRNGIMFYTLVLQNGIGCWNTQQGNGYRTQLQGVVAMDNATLVYPSDLKVDHEDKQSLWVISSRLPFFLYSSLDPMDINFRVLSGRTNKIVRGTVCDPKIHIIPSESYTATPCAL